LAGRPWRGVTCVVGLAALLAACASGGAPARVRAPSRPATPVPVPDLVPAVLAESGARLEKGLAAADEGHLDRARAEFDAAIDTLLSYPGGAYAEPRVAEAYRRALDTIHLPACETFCFWSVRRG